MTAIAVVKGGFWPDNGVNTLTQSSGVGVHRRTAAQWLGRKGTYALRETMRALDGIVAGGAALKNYGRVVAAEELGGLRATENQALINRATTAADVTAINADVLTLSTRTYTASPVPNLDGNPLGTR